MVTSGLCSNSPARSATVVLVPEVSALAELAVALAHGLLLPLLKQPPVAAPAAVPGVAAEATVVAVVADTVG